MVYKKIVVILSVLLVLIFLFVSCAPKAVAVQNMATESKKGGDAAATEASVATSPDSSASSTESGSLSDAAATDSSGSSNERAPEISVIDVSTANDTGSSILFVAGGGAADSEKPPVSDAGITIPLEEFINRIISLYEFEEKYSGFIRIYYIVNMLNGSLWVYMGGIDNTPVFKFDGNIIPKRFDDFKMNAEKYKGTRFGDKLAEYLTLLKSENYMRTQKVSDYIENLTFY